MSRNNKYDGYATYSTYNSSEKSSTSNATVTERFSNPPPPQTFPTPPQNQPVYNGSQIRANPQNMLEDRRIYQESPPNGNGGMSGGSGGPNGGMSGPGPSHSVQNQPEQPSQHRVHKVSTDKMYDLLTNPSTFFSQTGQPMRVFIKVFTDWCKPCKKIEPEIKSISMYYPSVFFLEVNGDELMQSEKLSSKLKVSSVPSFFGFVATADSSGNRYMKQVGFMTGVDMTEIKTLCDKIQNA
jgi:thiol-disulfide isomerase/thioredoxin